MNTPKDRTIYTTCSKCLAHLTGEHTCDGQVQPKLTWQEDFNQKFPYKGAIIEDNGDHYTFTDIKDFISTLRSDLLQQVIDELPKKMKMKPAEDTRSHAGWGMVTGFNESIDQVTSLLNKMRDENK